jgi:type IV pilus assembly protein PilB
VVGSAAARSAQVSWWRAGEAGVPASDEELQGEDAQAVEVVRALLLEAFERGFEELVFDAADDGLHVAERTARVSQSLTIAPRHLQQVLLGRLKWMAGLPSDRRRPQAGSFLAAARGREYVCRVYALPTIHGERVQIELIPSGVFSADLESLGITGAGADDFRWAVANPAGLLLLAAPPGHGREAAIRALLGLSRPNDEQAVALEDPVLVRMPGVAQVPVGRLARLTTTRALRTVLRRAPERLMIASINNPEAARLAVQAAASGSLVLAGMDAPDVFSALARLVDSEVTPFTLASALRLAASQRQLRRLCESCRESIAVNRDELLAAGCRDEQLGNATPFRPVGCDACHRGYQGHVSVFETLRIAGDLRNLVGSGTPVSEWRRKTLSWGFLTLRHTALLLALSGLTSLEEVLVGTPEDV